MNNLIQKQQAICTKFHSQFSPLADDAMVAVAIQTLGQMPINGLRYPLQQRDNVGWFIYCGEYSDDDDFFKPMHISHLYQLLPQVLPYLALAENFAFVIDDTDYEDVYRFA